MSHVEVLFPRTSTSFDRIEWGLIGDEDALRLSVCEVTSAEQLGDARMGPSRMRDTCATCGAGFMHCAGHFGHIDLGCNVVPRLMMPIVATVLKRACQCGGVAGAGQELLRRLAGGGVGQRLGRGADIDAPCRLGHQQNGRRQHHLAPHDELLQVAA